MGFWRKALVSIAVLGAWAGAGSALFAFVTPGEERVQAILKEMPGGDLPNRKEATRNKQLVMAALQEAVATQENVTWRKNWPSGGGGQKSA